MELVERAELYQKLIAENSPGAETVEVLAALGMIIATHFSALRDGYGSIIVDEIVTNWIKCMQKDYEEMRLN